MLRLLASDFTERQISREPYPSLTTVKSHAASCLREHGVLGRWGRFGRARRAGADPRRL
jgi:hypothetical protein